VARDLIIHLLIGPQTRDRDHTGLQLTQVSEILLANMGGLVSPLAVSMLIDD
jgi:hypothetical protein